MGSPNHASKSIPVEEYVAHSELHPSELVSMILDGVLPGELQGNRWFVARPLVVLEMPESARAAALMKVSAYRIGSYVTAGRGELGIPLRFDDPGRPAALDALNEAMTKVPDLPVEIHLNGEHFHIDSSLWVDLGAALVEFQTLTDPTIEEAL
jgi:hypothetical protein